MLLDAHLKVISILIFSQRRMKNKENCVKRLAQLRQKQQ